MIVEGQTTYEILFIGRQYSLYGKWFRWNLDYHYLLQSNCPSEDVSEGHVVPIEGREPIDFRSFLAYDMLGFYFKDVECYEIPESGLVRSRFIMSDAMMQVFPDDDEYGSRWMRSNS